MKNLSYSNKIRVVTDKIMAVPVSGPNNNL